MHCERGKLEPYLHTIFTEINGFEVTEFEMRKGIQNAGIVNVVTILRVAAT